MESILDQPQSSGSKRSIDEILQNGYSLSIGDAWNRGSEIWKKNIGGYVLYFIIGYAVIIALGLIPFVSIVTSFILAPALAAGFFISANSISTSGSVTTNDYTKGFKKMGDNALFILLSWIIMVVIFIPVFIALFSQIFMLIKIDYKSPDGIREMISLLAPVLGVFAICLLAAMLVYQLFALVYPLIHLYGLPVIEAMKVSAKVVLKQYLTFILLSITLFLLNMGGLLCLGLGVLFTLPLSYCILYAAYEIIFENKSSIAE
ncbi:MAG: hypothetical protein RJA07_250 [Bacteroidota bacterium]|jgi:MFS family permease